MSSTPQSVDGPQKAIQIPSLLTNSARAILEAFGEDIIQLRAHGSVETSNRAMIKDLREYGVSREQRTHQRITLDYERLAGSDGPSNPLTEDAQQDIFEEPDVLLSTESTDADPDLAVTSFTARITSEELQEVTPAQTPEFDLRFVADPAEEAVREPTKRLNIDRQLYSELGFNITNLNLRTVTETATIHHQQSDGRYLSWGGPTDIRPRSPDRLAVRINQHVLPDTYGMLKPYYVADDHVLELEEEAATEIDSLLTGSEGDDL